MGRAYTFPIPTGVLPVSVLALIFIAFVPPLADVDRDDLVGPLLTWIGLVAVALNWLRVAGTVTIDPGAGEVKRTRRFGSRTATWPSGVVARVNSRGGLAADTIRLRCEDGARVAFQIAPGYGADLANSIRRLASPHPVDLEPKAP